jgi:hypothetical protein
MASVRLSTMPLGLIGRSWRHEYLMNDRPIGRPMLVRCSVKLELKEKIVVGHDVVVSRYDSASHFLVAHRRRAAAEHEFLVLPPTWGA